MPVTDKSTIEKRGLKGAVWNALSFMMNMGQTIFLVPILLTFWSNETYGIWLSVFALFTMFQSFDIGHQTYVGNKMTSLYHAGNMVELKRVLASSIYIAVALGMAEVLAVIIFTYGGWMQQLLGVSDTITKQYHLTEALLALLLMWMLVGSVGGILVKLFNPIGKYASSQKWGIVSRLLQFSAIILAAMSHLNILGAAILIVLFNLVYCAFLFAYIKRILPELFPWWLNGSVKIGLQNFYRSIAITFAGILNQFNQSGIVLVISSYLHPSLVPAYTTLRTLSNTAVQSTSIVLSPLGPEITKFNTLQEFDKLKKVFSVNWFLSGIIINSGLILIIPFIEWIFSYWTKGKVEFSFPLFALLACSVTLTNFGSGFTIFINSTNQTKLIFLSSVLRVSVTLLLTYLFIGKMGLVAIGIGLFISELLSSIVVNLQFIQNKFKSKGLNLYDKQLLLSVSSCLVVIITYGLQYKFNTADSLISLIGFSVLLYIYYLKWKFLDTDVKLRIREFILTFLKKIKVSNKAS
ncbi:MAG: lipopolysaccharide biosynthesis protein [Cytophaga sp.]|uniref:lipopolysaccharide biosynthesis protein n=1 Tax=Cytophaga sp. TaxID=29535 RepID=UPI003F7D5560